MMRLVKGKSLSDTTKEAIIKMIMTEKFVDNRLPAESKLAERFGVSLPVVREALLLLREEGIVTKKHGSGNYFHRRALEDVVRLDQFGGFLELLAALGYEASDKIIKLETRKPQKEVARAMGLESGEEVLLYERQVFADGVPVVHCDNYFPRKYFNEPCQECVEQARSIFNIITMCLHKELAYGKMEFFPHLTCEEDLEQIMVKPGQPVIIMAETYYTLEDDPIAYSINKFNHNFIPIHILSR